MKKYNEKRTKKTNSTTNLQKNITIWEQFDEIYKFNDPVKDPDKQQIVPPEEYRPRR